MDKPFYGWVITACAFVVLFVTYGIQYSFGVFVPHMVNDLGWQRASLGGAFSLYSVVYTSFTLVSGRLTDTLGPRRVIAVGGILLGGGLIATSHMSAQWQLFFYYGLIAALGMSSAYIPCNMTLVRWFRRRRGLALGLASCGASCGIVAVPVLAAAIIARADWRAGLLVFGVAVLLVTQIVARFLYRAPQDLGLFEDGDPQPAINAAAATDSAAASLTLAQARTTPAFWILLAAFAATMTTVGVPFVHIASFADDLGSSAYQASLVVSIIGLFALCSNIGLGAASDRIGRKGALIAAYAAQVVAFMLFLRAEDVAMVYLGAAAFGIFYGGFASLLPALVGDLFGPAHAGTIGGLLIAGGGLLGAWGPAMAGYLRDAGGDYRVAFAACTVAAAFALLLYMLLPRPSTARG